MIQPPPRQRPPFAKAYSFAIITLVLFLLAWAGQFFFQMAEVANEAQQHGQPFQWSDFLTEFLSATFENWQSEFLQLVWQAAGLALFYFWGSSQSKESDDRLEAKIDALLRDRNIDPIQFEYEEEDKLGGPAKSSESQQSDAQRRTDTDERAPSTQSGS